MDDSSDPLLQFFTAAEAEKDNLLYTTLNIASSATSEEIRKAYRRLALLHHPDKHSSKNEEGKAEAAKEFQKIGFAYAVLSDDKRRKTYDTTGKTAENAFADAEEMGWDKYFETLFTRIDRKALDVDKAKYQGQPSKLPARRSS
jgi:DnaJ family protein C protein 9